MVNAEPEPDPDPEPCEVEDDGNPETIECGPDGSPLVFAPNQGTFAFTSLRDGVHFDLDGDGYAEQTSWTAPNSGIAFLARDVNGNGKIDSGLELFGNHTRVAHVDGLAGAAENGFEALRGLEIQVGSHFVDNHMATTDSMFSSLLLWVDDNHNGISEPYELSSAASAGLVSIDLGYRDSPRKDRFGNQMRQISRSSWQTDQGLKNKAITDVWFVRER